MKTGRKISGCHRENVNEEVAAKRNFIVFCRWKDLSFTDGNKYSYNPCFPFDEGNCAQAAVSILNLCLFNA